MAASKEFYEAASKDKALWDEAERATYEALSAFLKERGLEKEAFHSSGHRYFQVRCMVF